MTIVYAGYCYDSRVILYCALYRMYLYMDFCNFVGYASSLHRTTLL